MLCSYEDLLYRGVWCSPGSHEPNEQQHLQVYLLLELCAMVYAVSNTPLSHVIGLLLSLQGWQLLLR